MSKKELPRKNEIEFRDAGQGGGMYVRLMNPTEASCDFDNAFAGHEHVELRFNWTNNVFTELVLRCHDRETIEHIHAALGEALQSWEK